MQRTLLIIKHGYIVYQSLKNKTRGFIDSNTFFFKNKATLASSCATCVSLTEQSILGAVHGVLVENEKENDISPLPPPPFISSIMYGSIRIQDTHLYKSQHW